MNNWHLIPWTVQYLISGIFIIIISAIIFSRNKTSLAYQNFFAYGLSTTIWVVMAYLHRNAPDAELSILFFRIDLFFFSLSVVFLPLTILCMWGEKRAYLLLLLPSFPIGVYILFMTPFEIFWSKFGWSFKLSSGFGKVFYCISILYWALFCGAFVQLIRKAISKVLAKKYISVLIGYIFFYGIGIIITTLFLQKNKDFPPFGGILTLIQFLFIAYTITLRPEKIILFSSLKEPINDLSQSYIRFLNEFHDKIPGKELGDSNFRLQDYIDAIGLEEILVHKSGTLVFEADKFAGDNIKETPDSILRVMKEHPWAVNLANDFMPILIRTYKLLSQSENRADEWLNQIFRHHGGFLAKHVMLGKFSKNIPLPVVFKELTPSRTYLFKEDTPKKAYGMMKEVDSYGIESLCITKLPPQTIRERYGVRMISILWVTYQKGEKTITPQDFAGLTKAVSEFLMKPDGVIISMDCFDQLKFANGFEKSLDILKIIRALSLEKGFILSISIPPMMFEKEELGTIEKELK